MLEAMVSKVSNHCFTFPFVCIDLSKPTSAHARSKQHIQIDRDWLLEASITWMLDYGSVFKSLQTTS